VLSLASHGTHIFGCLLFKLDCPLSVCHYKKFSLNVFFWKPQRQISTNFRFHQIRIHVRIHAHTITHTQSHTQHKNTTQKWEFFKTCVVLKESQVYSLSKPKTVNLPLPCKCCVLKGWRKIFLSGVIEVFMLICGIWLLWWARMSKLCFESCVVHVHAHISVHTCVAIHSGSFHFAIERNFCTNSSFAPNGW